MAQPPEPADNTIASIRVACDDAGAMRNLLKVLEGALGKPASVSKPYTSRDGSGERVYLTYCVPRAPVADD